MASQTLPSVDHLHARRYGTCSTAALTTSSSTAALTVGTMYLVTANSSWHFAQGASASITATVASSFPIPAYSVIEVYASTDNDGVAAILDSGTGTLYCLPVLP